MALGGEINFRLILSIQTTKIHLLSTTQTEGACKDCKLGIDKQRKHIYDKTVSEKQCVPAPVTNILHVLLDFSLTVKAATLIFISGCGSDSSYKEGKSGFIYNFVKS